MASTSTTAAATTTGGDWSAATADILWLIISRLTGDSYIRFGAVCVSWRSVLAEKRLPPPPQIPLLILPAENNTVRFFNPYINKDFRRPLPHTGPGHRWIFSSAGYLVSFDLHSFELHLFNPLKDTTPLRLPSVASLPSFLGSPTTYFQRLAVSPDSPPIIAIICCDSRHLAFTRVGDSSWATTTHDNLSFLDFVFYRDQLYTLNSGRGDRVVVAFDLSDITRPRVSHSVKLPYLGRPPIGKSYHFSYYLVVSSGGDLLQVLRMTSRGRLDEDPFLVVRVFKMMDTLEANVKAWVEEESLGDNALFSSYKTFDKCIALSVKDFPELRRNSIYLIYHKLLGGFLKEGKQACDLGVFNSDSRSFEAYGRCEYEPTWSPCWFSPIATAPPDNKHPTL